VICHIQDVLLPAPCIQASSFKTAREYTLLVVSLASLGKSIGWQPPQVGVPKWHRGCSCRA
jgi:hypothetical protein